MQQRQEDFDYDIIPARYVMSLSPSIELRQLFSSAAADAKGSANLTGIADPVVDALIEAVIAVADPRGAGDPRPRARPGAALPSRSGCRTGTAAST